MGIFTANKTYKPKCKSSAAISIHTDYLLLVFVLIDSKLLITYTKTQALALQPLFTNKYINEAKINKWK